MKGRDYPTGKGKAFFRPLISLPDPTSSTLSFSNLVEAHVLRSLRVQHVVSIKAVREALECAHDEFKIDRLLLSPQLRAAPGELFLERYGQLAHLSKSGQLAMRALLESYLKRIEFDSGDLPVKLFPFVRPDASDERRIAISPFVAFGRPVIARKSISTAVIVGRIDAGESAHDVAADYDLDAEDIDEAVLYERAA